jgi:hypothetical protein
MGDCLFSAVCSPHLGLLILRLRLCLNLDTNVLGYILGDFFTNSFAHPVCDTYSDMFWTTPFKQKGGCFVHRWLSGKSGLSVVGLGPGCCQVGLNLRQLLSSKPVRVVDTGWSHHQHQMVKFTQAQESVKWFWAITRAKLFLLFLRKFLQMSISCQKIISISR